jgi:hypothetical protein
MSHTWGDFSRLYFHGDKENIAVPPKTKLRCTFLKACNAKWLVLIKGYTLSQAGVIVQVSPGTLSHIMYGRRFPGSFPIPLL